MPSLNFSRPRTHGKWTCSSVVPSQVDDPAGTCWTTSRKARNRLAHALNGNTSRGGRKPNAPHTCAASGCGTIVAPRNRFCAQHMTGGRPRSAPKICSYSGCETFVAPRNRYCPVHAKKVKKEQGSFGSQGAEFGSQGAEFGSEGGQFGSQGAEFGRPANTSRTPKICSYSGCETFVAPRNRYCPVHAKAVKKEQGSFGSRGAEFGSQGAEFGSQGGQFGSQGAEFGRPANTSRIPKICSYSGCETFVAPRNRFCPVHAKTVKKEQGSKGEEFGSLSDKRDELEKELTLLSQTMLVRRCCKCGLLISKKNSRISGISGLFSCERCQNKEDTAEDGEQLMEETIGEIPHELQGLTASEQQLLAKVQVHQCLYHMPRSGAMGLRGR
eukprot:4735203-Amphidinium_carterae.1